MNPQTPFSWIPRGLVLAAATLLLISGTACAANPADDVPSAVVGDPITAVEDDAAMADDAAMDEESSDDSMSEDGMTEGEDDAAAEAESAEESAPAMGEAIALDGAISFTGSKVTGSHTCVFQDWQGALDPGEGTAETATLSFAVDTASLFCDEDTRNSFTEKFETHMTEEDFFWSEMYPEATFASTSIVDGGEGDATHTISGDLTIRGITQQISFPATVKVDDAAVAGMAEFAVDRQLWEMAFAGQPDDLIRDEVVISINLNGTR